MGINYQLSIIHYQLFIGKYEHPQYFAKHENNLKRKQQKVAIKEKVRSKRFSNLLQDFLQKLSAKLVRENKTVVVENIHIIGIVCQHKLAKNISDCGWGMLLNFLVYKLEPNDGKLVKIDRWFPSSSICSNCFEQVDEILRNVREWTCHN